MRILMTGGHSLLGKSLWQLAPKNSNILFTRFTSPSLGFASNSPAQQVQLDVTNKHQVMSVVSSFHPDLIIHLAAESDVDRCQNNPKRAREINVLGTENMVKAAELSKVWFVLASTNSIFDGNKSYYRETDAPNPRHVYGKSKLQAEKIIMKSRLPYLIVRITPMYGWEPEGGRQNPVTWALTKLNSGKTLHTVDDIFVNPLYAPSAADAIWKLSLTKSPGIYHIAGKTRVNRYQWMQTIAEIFSFNTSLIKAVPSSFFPEITPRPKDTSLSTEKIENTVNWQPLSLAEALTRMHNAHPEKNK